MLTSRTQPSPMSGLLHMTRLPAQATSVARALASAITGACAALVAADSSSLSRPEPLAQALFGLRQAGAAAHALVARMGGPGEVVTGA